MIQRLQSVYLFAIIVLALITCTGPVIDFQERVSTTTAVVPNTADTLSIAGSAKAYTLNAIYLNTYVNGDLQSSDIQYLLILLIAVICGWTLNIILKFKDRKKQMLFTKLNFLLLALYPALVIATAYMKIPNFGFTGMTIKASIGLAISLFMLYLNFRALMLMRRDDDLVKSADRIR